MPLHLLNAVEDGQRVNLATSDTARLALKIFRDALAHYRRVWATDQDGADVSEADLVKAANQERALFIDPAID